MNILYISYDGLMEPLGYSQVFRYLKELAGTNRICLLTYEKKEDWNDVERRQCLLDEVAAAGIRWYPLRYHKRPTLLATSFDVAVGFLLGSVITMRHRIAIVHARSYVPSLIALPLKRLFGLRFVFDMRGFWADEKVDNGSWSRGSTLYRLAKWFERRFLLAADKVISLTRAAVDEMRTFGYLRDRSPSFEVITTCADLQHFHRLEGTLDAGGRFTLGYVGAASFSYRFDEALMCFKLLRELEPDAKLLILNHGEHEFIEECMARHGIARECVELRAVGYRDLPREMSRMDACVFFIRQVYSKIASAPTKLGELLGCGVPCLTNAGVGDMSTLITAERVGIIVSSVAENAMRNAASQILVLARESRIHERCRQAAERHFALSDAVRAYQRMYSELEVQG